MSDFPVQIHSFPTHQIIVGSMHFDDPIKAAEFAMKERFAVLLGYKMADGYQMNMVEAIMRAVQANPKTFLDMIVEYHERVQTYKLALATAAVAPVPGDAPKFPSKYNKDGPKG